MYCTLIPCHCTLLIHVCICSNLQRAIIRYGVSSAGTASWWTAPTAPLCKPSRPPTGLKAIGDSIFPPFFPGHWIMTDLWPPLYLQRRPWLWPFNKALRLPNKIMRQPPITHRPFPLWVVQVCWGEIHFFFVSNTLCFSTFLCVFSFLVFWSKSEWRKKIYLINFCRQILYN